MKQAPPIVFVGPTIARAEVEDILPDAMILPPAMQGELLSAVREFRPRAVGLIDGLWNACPSVWHKEITAALSMGVPVLGAASMGALRAVECEAYGAEPVGVIADRVRQGLDDDEVVLLHSSAEDGYRELTVPMINLRCTIEKMVEAGSLDENEGRLWIAELKGIFYGDRSWGRIGEVLGMPEAADLCEHYIDQKEADARTLCFRLARRVSLPHRREKIFKAHWGFGAVMQQNDLIVPSSGGGRRLHEIAADAPADIKTAAMDRALALQYALSLGLDVDTSSLAPDAEWCRVNDMTLEDGAQLLWEEAVLDRARNFLIEVDSGMGWVPKVNHLLRVRGDYTTIKNTERNQ
jgi:hypothetical protein